MLSFAGLSIASRLKIIQVSWKAWHIYRSHYFKERITLSPGLKRWKKVEVSFLQPPLQLTHKSNNLIFRALVPFVTRATNLSFDLHDKDGASHRPYAQCLLLKWEIGESLISQGDYDSTRPCRPLDVLLVLSLAKTIKNGPYSCHPRRG